MDQAVSLPAINSKQSKGFLSLPRELRDLVYQEALADVVAPPRNSEDVGPRLKVGLATGSETRCIYYPADLYPQASCQGLLSSNRQIRAEIRESHPTLDYHLDIMIEDFENGKTNTRVWPTWTLYPQPVSNVRELCVNVRVLGPSEMEYCFYFT